MKKLSVFLFIFVMMFTTACGGVKQAAPSECTTKIHFLCISKDNSAMDCIVIESRGRFGLVDCGYWDQREMITRALSEIGVTEDNLDFIIGTHAHADHIGAMNYLIKTYHVERMYLMPFTANCLVKPEEWLDESWANVMKTADKMGLPVVDTFEEGAGETPWNPVSDESGLADESVAAAKTKPAGRGKAHNHYTADPHFTFGDAEIDIYNYSQDYMKAKVENANDTSLVVKVTAGGHTALLTGDVSNAGPRGKDPGRDEDAIADLIGHVDLLKLSHHGYGWYDTNTVENLRKYDADYIVQTGATSMLFTDEPNTYDEIIREVKKGVSYVSTFWYDRRVIGGDGLYAITYNMRDLTSNVPEDVRILAVSRDGRSVMMKGGHISDYKYDDKTYLSTGSRNDYGVVEVDGILYEIDNNSRILNVVG